MAYRDKLNAILRNANVDPSLADDAMPEDSERSWTLQRPARGRPKKRLRMEFGEESIGEDEEDEEDGEKKGNATLDMNEEIPEALKEDREKPVKLIERSMKLEPQPSTSVMPIDSDDQITFSEAMITPNQRKRNRLKS